MPGPHDLPDLQELIENPHKFFNPVYLPGCYRGYVRINDDDPDQNGGLRIEIPAIHNIDEMVKNGSAGATRDDIYKILPLATPMIGDGGEKDYGDFYVPEVDDTVWVIFEHGHRDHPRWLGTWWGSPNDEPEAPAEVRGEKTGGGSSKYTKRRIIKSRYFHRIEISDEPDNLEIIIRTGLNKEPGYPKPKLPTDPTSASDGENVTERRLTLRDSDDFGFELCTPQGVFRMDDANKKMTVFWDGDYEEHITGNKTVTVDKTLKTYILEDEERHTTGSELRNIGGNLTWSISGFFSATAGLAITMMSATMQIMNASTSAIVGSWTWTGSKHTRNGQTSDSGPNSHG